MGQYQQWLYHREVDQQLRAQLELLQQELQHLQKQAALLGDVTSCTDNPIVQAIAMQQSAESLFVDRQESSLVGGAEHTTANEQVGETVSLALFAWGRLPNIDTQEMQLQGPKFSSEETEEEAPATPHPEVTLLPADMATSIDTHTQTVPRLALSRLVRQAHSRTKELQKQEATAEDRTDYSIQRWRERWGRQGSHAPQSAPDEPEPGEDRA